MSASYLVKLFSFLDAVSLGSPAGKIALPFLDGPALAQLKIFLERLEWLMENKVSSLLLERCQAIGTDYPTS